jgi:hypothetical protein
MKLVKQRGSVSPFHVYFETQLIFSALITISTRASLKRYHSYSLTLGQGDEGDEWSFQQIGTTAEKDNVEKELADLRERLAKVEEWKKRRQDIDDELNKVWVSTGEELAPPAYVEKDDAKTISSLTTSEPSLISVPPSEEAT